MAAAPAAVEATAGLVAGIILIFNPQGQFHNQNAAGGKVLIIAAEKPRPLFLL